jgi:hypothetical protein
MALTKSTSRMTTGASTCVLDWGAIGDGSTDDTTAIQACIDSGARVIEFPGGYSFKITAITVYDNSNPRILTGYGANIVLSAAGIGISVKGQRHRIEGLSFTQSASATLCQAVRILNDNSYPIGEKCVLRNLRGTSVYRGIEIYMGVNGVGQSCYRCIVEDCHFENFTNQKTWSGSWGLKFGGPNAGDAGGNDSRVYGGLWKGYEKNIVIENSANTQLFGVSSDYGGTALYYDGGSDLMLLGGYFEYNDVFVTAANSPVRLFIYSPAVANFTTWLSGTIATSEGRSIVGQIADQSVAPDYRTGFLITHGVAGTTEVDNTNGFHVRFKQVDAVTDGGILKFGRQTAGPGWDWSGIAATYSTVVLATLAGSQSMVIGNVGGSTGFVVTASGDHWPWVNGGASVGSSSKKWAAGYFNNAYLYSLSDYADDAAAAAGGIAIGQLYRTASAVKVRVA